MNAVLKARPKKREYLPEEFKLTVWSRLRPYYHELFKRAVDSAEELERWILDRSELEAVVSESFSWRYIRVSADSRDERARDLYQYAVQELSPKIASFENKLNQKLVDSPFLDQLDPKKYSIYIQRIKNAVSLFCEENIPLTTDVQLNSKEYGKIFSEMTVGLDGKQMTLQKAGTLLEEKDRNRREAAYHLINSRIRQDKDQLEDLFDKLLNMRHQIALNAGFDNFLDYKFKALGRFDYTVEDCREFHRSIAHEILPIIDELNRYRRETLGLKNLRPWDLNVDVRGTKPLQPFRNLDELLGNTISCLNRLDPVFGQAIGIMRKMGHLDLESRKGKRPGGYNMTLYDTGIPFIFMNATKSFGDMRTLLHESGHAVHSFLTRDYRINSAKRFPAEVSELAAMSMELLTMDHWDVFFNEPEDLNRARIQQLENVLRVLPWIAAVDKFQHWLYLNPGHSREERKKQWVEIYYQFTSSEVDRQSLEKYAEYLWHKQLHIFEVPFYYIEYGMAQLGAIAMWQQYRHSSKRAISNYTQ
ncbi:MAG: M3 family oligoendopeptidase, partial [Saprospiraceae bacterium]|nr:M3 family oligoendopeptidase [Saprospiraceae bacterium]